jgi:7-carboxy-7-deazaguanine synthase
VSDSRDEDVKKYAIKEVFGTLQGEGAQAGTPALFLRFAGCNLGYEVCPWCDTDWVKPEWILPLADTLRLVRERAEQDFGQLHEGLLLVATGGEPSLQFDATLSDGLRAMGFRIAMESNGARPVDRTLVDWLTISPKQPHFAQTSGDELKIVYTGGRAPGPGSSVAAVRALAEGTHFKNHFLQPIDLPEQGGPNYDEVVAAVMELGPPWRLSVQTHKVLAIP